ncbi:fdxN element excision recombinase XisF [Pseudanabaena mucicola]|uniref:fdxN element excision recombinase XisF n=1 Tax=Pseudanabaena mucicola TaxID=71190 RepID=UPI002578B9E0|nr:fdxN element excision recombinase XisF [Pseudanabaena mucicola]
MKIGYARVSTREQSENSHALEQQIARLKAAGATEIYSDVESGSKNSRPKFKQLIADCKLGRISEVIVTRLDRLTRSLVTLRKTIDQLKDAGVSLVALDDSIDTSTAVGKFHLNMLGSLAEMEVDRLSERVRHGWKHLRDRKVAMNPPFGYCKINDKHTLDHQKFLCLLSDRTELSKAEIAQDIINAFFQERSLRGCLRVINPKYGIFTSANNNHGENIGGVTARGLFRFSITGLKDWLINPVLQGHLCYLKKRNGQRLDRSQWQIFRNTHEALITEQQSREIDEILAHNRQVRGYGTQAQRFPLSGLVFCAECRAACYSCASRIGTSKTEFHYYFQCKNAQTRSCNNRKLVRQEKCEAAAIASLTQRASQIADIAELPLERVEPVELRELRGQLAVLENLGYNPAIATAKEQLRAQISNLEYGLTVGANIDTKLRDALIDTFGNPVYFSSLPLDEKKAIYRALIDRIVVKDGGVVSVELKI